MINNSVRFTLALMLALVMALMASSGALRAAPSSAASPEPPASPAPAEPSPEPAAPTTPTVVPTMSKTVQAALAALGKAQTLIEFYYMETGSYPDTLEDMVAQYNQGVKPDQTPITLPTDPATGKKLVYEPSAEKTTYVVKVPDPSAYGETQLSVKNIDWGWMNQLAVQQKRQRMMLTCARYQELLVGVVNKYNKDNRNKFPETLEVLIPQYIKNVPSCPVAKKPYTYKHDERGFEVGCPDPAAHNLEVFRFSSTEGLKRYP